jgi:Flp pilus assembly protein TadG
MKQWKKIAAETSGAEIAEAAFVLPILFAVLFAIVWFGRAFNIYATLNRAAREGAQAAAVSSCATCIPTIRNQAYIQTSVVNPRLSASHIDPAPATVILTTNVLMNPGATPPETGVSVSVSYTYGFQLYGIGCCPLHLAPLKPQITMNATAQARQED